MPHIIVKLIKGKSEAQKIKLAEEFTKVAMNILNYGEESFSVSIEDIEPNDWKEKVFKPDILNNENILYKKPGYSIDDL